MTVDVGQEQGQANPPEAWIEQVRGALEHLYDLSYLQHHPLAQGGGFQAGYSPEIAGQRLRRDLAATIESLSPGPGVPFRAPHARQYNLLTLRYVEGLTVQNAANKLGISRRQASRDLRRGIESVAAMLWVRRSTLTPPEPRAVQLSSVEAEMARLETHPHPVDMREFLQRAQEVVEPQAVERDVRFHAMVPEGPVIVSADPVMAEQVLVNTLSRAVGQAHSGALHVTLKAGEEEVTITLQFFLESGTSTAPTVNLVVAQLADHLGWRVSQEDEPEGRRTVALSIAACGPTVLVIDDNEGLVELVERYLTDHACRVVAAANGQEGLLLAQELLPDAVVLDVMMPGTHGWEVLQRLRNHPTTANVPVVICSVINNPELAYSLGASLFLSKPISRDRVLDALRQLGVV